MCNDSLVGNKLSIVVIGGVNIFECVEGVIVREEVVG